MKADRFIALDIGTELIRMGVFMRRGSGLPELIDYGSVRLEDDPEKDMPREAAVAIALKHLLDPRKLSVRKAVISIEGQAVFSRLVTLPPVWADQLQQTIRHEAVQNIPFPIDEVVWNARVLGPAAAEPEVLLVAVKADVLNGLVDAVHANGLRVERVEAAPVALANAVRSTRSDESAPCLLVEVEPQATNLVLIDGDRTVFRALPGAAAAGAQLGYEIERSISYFRSKAGGREPQRILLTGNTGHMDEAELRLQRPVEVFDPLRHIQQSVMVSDPGSTAVLAGLALGGPLDLNLVPDALRKERGLRRREPVLIAAAAAAVLLAGVWLWGMHAQLEPICSQTAPQVAARVEQLDAMVRKLAPDERRMNELGARAQVFRLLAEKRSFWIETLSEIRRQLTDGMFLLSSEPIREGDCITGLRITVLSYLDREPDGQDVVVQLRDRLKDSDRFSDQTRVFKRPAKRRFSRQFVLDVYFAEAMQ